MRNHLTTTQAAAALDISVTAVQKLCDSGALRCFKIPGSKHRKIPVAEVLKFMRNNRWPADTLSRAVKQFE